MQPAVDLSLAYVSLPMLKGHMYIHNFFTFHIDCLHSTFKDYIENFGGALAFKTKTEKFF